MTRFNTGQFKGTTYTKKVSFAGAVLWKDKQISLNLAITNLFKTNKTETVIFEDESRNERWTASVDELRVVRILKTEGQERQFYFPISVFKVTPIKKVKVPKPPVEVKRPQQTSLL